METSTLTIVFELAVLLFSVVLHEVSHGYAALFLGDKTAKYAGRLTLNPIAHLDPVGSLLVPVLSSLAGVPFGWARPVPFNPYNLRNQKWGPAIVGVAGPLANITLAVVFGLVIRFLPSFSNVLPGPFFFRFIEIAHIITFVNLFLAVFNLVPIPPLDGSKLLFAILSYRWHQTMLFLEQYGFFFLLFLLMFGGGEIIARVVWYIFYIVTGSSPI